MSKIVEILTKIESRFIASAASGLDVVFQFSIDDETHHFVIKNGTCQLVAGEHNDANVTLITDENTFDDMVAGELSGMQAFLSGRVKAEGELMLATRLSDLFDI